LRPARARRGRRSPRPRANLRPLAPTRRAPDRALTPRRVRHGSARGQAPSRPAVARVGPRSAGSLSTFATCAEPSARAFVVSVRPSFHDLHPRLVFHGTVPPTGPQTAAHAPRRLADIAF